MTPNIIPYRKEFLAGLSGLGGGPTGLSLGGSVAKKTYIDDIFSTYLYPGNNSNIVVNNGLDLSGEGGLVWVKNRDTAGYGNFLFDTVRGTSKAISSNLTNNQFTESKGVHTFSEDGFTIGGSGGDAAFNSSGTDYVSWSFRKAPGFLDIQEYSDGSSNTSGSIGNPNFQVNHQLGSIPGMILIKNTSANASWFAWIKGQQGVLNSDGTLTGSGALPIANVTDTYIKFTAGNGTFNDPHTYIAYLFAGGESTAATAASGDFDGSNDYLYLSGSTDLNLTGDFTIEFWVYPRSQSTSRQSIIQTGSWGSQYAVLQISNQTQGGLDKKAQLWDYDMNQSMPIIYSNADIEEGQWTHIAFTRSSGTIKIWINGILDKTATGLSDSIDFGHANTLIGKHDGGTAYYLNGKLSNLRIVKGTAIYTSSFRPPTEPLTNITNTKLLCLQNSSTVNAATVSPGTISKDGSPGPTASTDSPFDDPAGFVFGNNGKENVIKIGTYRGNTSADFKVDVGWEPQMIMFKAIGGAYNWSLFDSMRGIVTEGNENYLYPNLTNSEYTAERISLTPTGFIVDKDSGVLINENNTEYAWIAIRRPDGYVGKPPEAGTSVLTMTPGTSGAPLFLSPNHIVDFALQKSNYASGSADWSAVSRLTQGFRLETNTANAEEANTYQVGDYQNGWSSYGSGDGSRFGFLFKRYAGLDVVTAKPQTGVPIPHGLNAIPEMIWAKDRGQSAEWSIYHKGLNGGTNPEQYLSLIHI